MINSRDLAGLIADTAKTKTLAIKGHVEVELVDPDTGRVVDRQAGDNYVQQAQWDAYARTIQKAVWLYGYEGDASTITPRALDGRDPRVAPTIRNDHLACWTDATPQNPTDIFTFGDVTAWAHRWPQGSPTQRQGIVQPSLCTLTDTAVSWMWEWSLLCGNGTFQSVGWRRLSIGGGAPDPSISDLWVPHRRMASAPGFVDTWAGGGVNSSTWWPGAGCPMYFNAPDASLYSVTAGGALQRRPVTFDASGNYILGAVVDLSTSAIAPGVFGDNPGGTKRTFGLTRLGPTGDWISVGYTGGYNSPDARNARAAISRTTPAGAIVYTNSAAFTTDSGFIGVTFDGANLWAISFTAPPGYPVVTETLVHRIDPATGNITATINAVSELPAQIPNWATSGPIGIAWDATNNWLWVSVGGLIYNINTSGVWQGVLISGNATPDPPSGVFTGASAGYNTPGRGTADWDVVNQSFGNYRNVGGYGIGGIGDQPSISKILAMNGKFWTYDGSIAYQFDGAPNFMSRTLLPDPVTKTNAQAMRIRYTMTFT